ncbi:MAG TPA: arginine deiminase family protein [Victivallales bacterium]|nr:arginine deiminase family protein [Victivallales bacterium]
MFSNVIVRKPCCKISDGITSDSSLGKPEYKNALRQHDVYVKALKNCNVEVIILDADENYPDSCFVEDVAVLGKDFAIITNPGAHSRKGEEKEIIDVIKQFYDEKNIEYIMSPGTLEGGDVMMVGNHFYIGLSARTNKEGALQLISILEKYGCSGTVVSLKEVLHLKTGLAYLENNNLLVSGEFVNSPEFKGFNKIIIEREESYSANCIWVNDRVIIPEGYPRTLEAVNKAGYETIIVDTSEFRKIDGGLSCLSLRF